MERSTRHLFTIVGQVELICSVLLIPTQTQKPQAVSHCPASTEPASGTAKGIRLCIFGSIKPSGVDHMYIMPPLPIMITAKSPYQGTKDWFSSFLVLLRLFHRIFLEVLLLSGLGLFLTNIHCYECFFYYFNGFCINLHKII